MPLLTSTSNAQLVSTVVGRVVGSTTLPYTYPISSTATTRIYCGQTGTNSTAFYGYTESGTMVISGTSSSTSVMVYTGTGTQNVFVSQTGIIPIENYSNVYQQRYVPPKIDYRQRRIKRDYARKALFKSVRLFENLFGINQIKLFLNGEAFEVEGRLFNYRISKSRYGVGVLEHTANPSSHVIPYNLEVYNKQGLQLFHGCTVFKNTPIIDQITALILHIQSGEEEQVLKNMNISKLTNDFYMDVDSINIINRIQNKKLIPK